MSDIIAQVKPPFSELRENNRLQWMIFAGLLIVFFTVITWLSGTITDLRSDNVQSQDLAVRLQNISEQVFDEALLSETRSQVDQEISLLSFWKKKISRVYLDLRIFVVLWPGIMGTVCTSPP